MQADRYDSLSCVHIMHLGIIMHSKGLNFVNACATFYCEALKNTNRLKTNVFVVCCINCTPKRRIRKSSRNTLYRNLEENVGLTPNFFHEHRF